MSIGTEITRLANAKSAIATAITNKGVTVPSSTKLDGMAALINSIANQAELESITVNTPPTKLDYISGDTFDATGLVLTVLVGEVEIDITSGYTITPETMAADTTVVTISFTAGGKTVSTTQAVNVVHYSTTFANNTWEKIVEACNLGLAQTLWAVGDVSPAIELYGQSIAFRIVAFDHDSLSTSDSKYNDASYNNGSKKAIMTLETVNTLVGDGSPYSRAGFAYNANLSGGKAYWTNSTLKKTILPAILALFPKSLSGSIRTVQKKTQSGPWESSLVSTNDQLFVLSQDEIFSRNAGEGTRYSYYQAGNSPAKTKADGSTSGYWLRGPYPNDNYNNQVGLVNVSGQVVSAGGSGPHPLSFGFCI